MRCRASERGPPVQHLYLRIDTRVPRECQARHLRAELHRLCPDFRHFRGHRQSTENRFCRPLRQARGRIDSPLDVLGGGASSQAATVRPLRAACRSVESSAGASEAERPAATGGGSKCRSGTRRRARLPPSRELRRDESSGRLSRPTDSATQLTEVARHPRGRERVTRQRA